MKKLLGVFALWLLSNNMLAQENATSCQQTKWNKHTKIKKKSRAGAYANSLMSRYDVHFYHLDINAERNNTLVSGNTTIGAKVTASSLDTFCFELNSTLQIDSILVNGTNTPFARNAAITYTVLSTSAAQNTNLYVKIFYGGDASVTGGSAIGDGYSTGTSPSWGNAVTWSLSEPYSAYEWFPCKQFLQDKADSSWVYVTTDSANKVGSNGILQGVDTGLPNGKVRYRWKSNYMIDYYLISVAISKYVDYTIYAHPSALPNDSIPIVNYVYNNPQTLPFFKNKIDTTAMLLEYFSDKLGLYPFYKEKYGHAMAPFGGGMEHQTMSSMGNFSTLGLIAHELMHQWFGDYVTCHTWSDIFINEGFASYGEYLAFEKFRSLTAAQNLMANVHDDIMALPDAQIYFTDTNNVNRIFDGIQTYDKGNAVIHTLRFIMGDDSLFFGGLRNFLDQYAFSTASIPHLKQSLETYSGINLGDYFNQWIYGAGHPKFSVERYSTANQLNLKISHTTSSSITTLFRGPLELKCNFAGGGDTTIRLTIDQNTNYFIVPMPDMVQSLSVDPNNWILNEVVSNSLNPDLISLSTSGIDLEQSVQIYPNPSHTEFTIKANEAFDFAISSMDGRMIQKGESKANAGQINSSHFPEGIYMVHIRTQNGTSLSRKLAVRH